MTVAIYPGSFDPVTKGHLDIIKRAAKIFDKVIVGVLINKNKTPMFSLKTRENMIRKSLKCDINVEVDSFEGLLTDYIDKQNIDVIIKGLRAVSDFESEFQMATMNRTLNKEAETFFLVTDMKYAHLSSSLVKEVFSLGGNIDEFVTPVVLKNMKQEGSNG